MATKTVEIVDCWFKRTNQMGSNLGLLTSKRSGVLLACGVLDAEVEDKMPVPSKDNVVIESDALTRQSQKLIDLMTKTGYRLVQINGQRRFGGPPPNWSGPAPPKDSEIFVGKIPRNCYEDELVPIFEQIGLIYELRLMMDFSGSNRGYAFVMFSDPETAEKAVKELNNFEIRPGRRIGVVKSVNNCRLYIGGLPVHTNQRAIKEVIVRLTENVANIHVNTSNGKNRRTQYAIVEYESHRDAAMARRRLIPDRVQLWGRDIVVDWAAVNTTRNAQRSRNHPLKEDLDLFEEPDISSPIFSLNQQLDKNHTNHSTKNAFTKGLWSLERAMDEELYGIPVRDTKSIDRKPVVASEPSVCCPGKMRFLSNLKQVNCVGSLYDTFPSNSFGGLATKIFEGNVNYVNGLHDYCDEKYLLKQQPSVPELSLSLNETQKNRGMENIFAKIHEDQLSKISGKTLSDLIADLNINCEDTINNCKSFCNQILENKNYIFNPLMNLSEDKVFDQKGKANVSVLTNAGLGYTKQEQVLGNSFGTTQTKSLKRFNPAPGTPVIPSYSATTYAPVGYEDSSQRLLNQYQRMFLA